LAVCFKLRKRLQTDSQNAMGEGEKPWRKSVQEGKMATIDGKGGTVTLEELLITSLAQTDAVAKLLIEKGVFTQDEFMEKIKAERATYQEMFQKVGH